MKTFFKIGKLLIAIFFIVSVCTCKKDKATTTTTATTDTTKPYTPIPCSKYALCLPFRYSPTYMPYGGIWSGTDPVTMEVNTEEPSDWTGSSFKFKWVVGTNWGIGFSYIPNGSWTAMDSIQPGAKKVVFQYKGTPGLQLLVHVFPISNYHLGWVTVTCSDTWQTGVMTLTSSDYTPYWNGPFTVQSIGTHVTGDVYTFYIKNIIFE